MCQSFTLELKSLSAHNLFLLFWNHFSQFQSLIREVEKWCLGLHLLPCDHQEYQVSEKIVIRRYNNFMWVHDRLAEKFKGVFIPPLPEKSTVGNMMQNCDSFFPSSSSSIFNGDLLCILHFTAISRENVLC
ncbi:Phox homology domain-containing protein [Dioscorea alata]|uniref:Phox homology domain-containing protein n=1 Tax=Dioscorea alata TaxID=55571 RepID=A0ACB7W2B0_DIOAL|nr:Phox homology domain-containing protein [Dioscorea alata]